MKKKVAILYICTAKYVVFWKDFFDSYEEYFLPECEKHYYVFTDAEEIHKEKECDRIHKFYQESLGWPNNTLMRFHIFAPHFEELKSYDYLFFMNANCQCMETISAEEFLPKEKNILVVQHPGFYNKNNTQFTYDRNPESTAYIPMGEGKYYVCGGVNGGKSEAFIALMQQLMENIDKDNEKDIIALWHDESQLNRLIAYSEDYEMLSPAYCYPEGTKIPFPEKIRIREKSKWVDVDNIKHVGLKMRLAKFYYETLRRGR